MLRRGDVDLEYLVRLREDQECGARSRWGIEHEVDSQTLQSQLGLGPAEAHELLRGERPCGLCVSVYSGARS